MRILTRPLAHALLTALVLTPEAAIAQHGAPAGEWPTYGGDSGSTKYAPLDQISDFRYVRGGSQSAAGPLGFPLVKGPHARLTAIDLSTGEHAGRSPWETASGSA